MGEARVLEKDTITCYLPSGGLSNISQKLNNLLHMICDGKERTSLHQQPAATLCLRLSTASKCLIAQQAAITLKLWKFSPERPEPDRLLGCFLQPTAKQAMLRIRASSESTVVCSSSFRSSEVFIFRLDIIASAHWTMRSKSSFSWTDLSRCRRVCTPVLLKMIPVKTSISVILRVAWSE